ncbi:MAG: hypothetical protein J5590_09130 [Clostridia bacterium]|nr:hypothetical protein [Clostridia bacterium]
MADFTADSMQGVTGGDVETALIRLYKTLDVMFSSLNSQNVKSLQTDKTKIASSDGYTEIDGAKLIMRDRDDNIRLELGSDGEGNFNFTLNNASGRKSIELSSTGDAVFSGDIETARDASVGDNLYIGRDENGEGIKKIQFYDDEYDDAKKVRIEALKDAQGKVTLRIIAEKVCFSTLDGVISTEGYPFAVAADGNAYVTINGINYPVHYR